jgi:hypothetical protein
MSIKLAVLRSGESVISDVKELIADDNICGYLFEEPHVVEVRKTGLLMEEDASEDSSGDISVSLTPWIFLSKDEKIPVRPDWIVTIVEPIDTIRQMYEDKVNGQESSVSSVEE